MTDTRVLYNDSCPICAREIKHYADLAERGGLPVRFDGLAEAAADWGIDPDTAARQIHVRQGDQLLTGVQAFVALWAAIPRYRWLARCVGAPVLRPVAEAVYTRLLAPMLYAMHRRRQRRRKVTLGKN